MTTMLKKIRWDLILEAVAVFALLGAALEGLHPGLVSDVVPWFGVAAVALALTLAVVMTEKVGHHDGASRRPGFTAAIVVATVLAAAGTAAAYAYFAPIPRFQAALAVAVGLIVLLGASVLTQEKR